MGVEGEDQGPGIGAKKISLAHIAVGHHTHAGWGGKPRTSPWGYGINNVWRILNDEQRERIIVLAREQAEPIQYLAMMRFPLAKAFHRELEGNVPSGSAGLNLDAVVKCSGDLFAFDGAPAFRRSISAELRQFMSSSGASQETVQALARRYGELDGEMSWYCATHFARVRRTLSVAQIQILRHLRDLEEYPCSGAWQDGGIDLDLSCERQS